MADPLRQLIFKFKEFFIMYFQFELRYNATFRAKTQKPVDLMSQLKVNWASKSPFFCVVLLFICSRMCFCLCWLNIQFIWIFLRTFSRMVDKFFILCYSQIDAITTMCHQLLFQQIVKVLCLHNRDLCFVTIISLLFNPSGHPRRFLNEILLYLFQSAPKD